MTYNTDPVQEVCDYKILRRSLSLLIHLFYVFKTCYAITSEILDKTLIGYLQ